MAWQYRVVKFKMYYAIQTRDEKDYPIWFTLCSNKTGIHCTKYGHDKFDTCSDAVAFINDVLDKEAMPYEVVSKVYMR